MRLNDSTRRLALIGWMMLAGPATAQDAPPPSTGPQATSDRSADRYDEVGYAIGGSSGSNANRALPLGSYVEVTSLDSGRTVLVRIDDRGVTGVGVIIGLSQAAARTIGVTGRAAVRVRRVTPSAADQAALKRGEAASPRLDTPPALLAGLRAKLTDAPFVIAPTRPSGEVEPPVAAARRPAATTVKPAPVVKGGYYVQVGTFSSKDRANALARILGGSASPFAKLWRVRTGPFADAKSAARARDAVAARGYGDARVVRED